MRLVLGSVPRPLFIVALPLLILALVRPAFGQLPERLEKCLPYPTLAQEIQKKQQVSEPARLRIHVMSVEFDADDGIPADAQEEISAGLRNTVFERGEEKGYLLQLANEIAEVPVREALRNRGYFKMTATAKATELWRDAAEVGVVVAVRATPGPQYRMGNIQIQSADPDLPLAIYSEVLRSLIPLQRGELFSVERVRAGLEELGRVYGRQGYLDMTPEPDTEVDDAQGTVDLVIKIDQQVQYRVGSIEFLGVNSTLREKFLLSLPKPGEVLDKTRLDEFFKANRAVLPSDVSMEDMSLRRDYKTRTVAILFDFRACPSN